MTDLAHHYKDREPEETIQIIEDFFNKRGCKLKCAKENYSEADTYSCMYYLYWNNISIAHANGKGYTYTYAKASCFAEMYERFCMYSRMFGLNKFITKDLMNLNQKEYGYYLCEGEKIMSYEDIKNESYLNNIFTNIMPIIEQSTVDQFIRTFYNNGICYGAPYKSLQDNTINYKDMQMIANFYGTTGFAAGNTLEEALVQGSSEYFERITISKYFSIMQEYYYYLKTENLPEELQRRVKLLEATGLEVKLYDMSYNFGLPVCMLFLNDKQNHLFYLNFASSPVFDIAAERCFTEMYQGANFIPRNHKIFVKPNNYPCDIICRATYKSTHNHVENVIPEGLFLNSKEIEYYNKEVFVASGTHTNKELLERIKKFDKELNMQLCYHNISLSNDMVTIHVLPKERIILGFDSDFDYLRMENDFNKIKILNLTEFIMENLEYAINHQDISEDKIEVFCNQLIAKLKDIDNKDLFHGFSGAVYHLNHDIYNVINNDKHQAIDDYRLFFNLLMQDFSSIQLTAANGIKHLYQGYMLALSYKQDGYPDDIIKKIYNGLGYNNIDINFDISTFNTLTLIKKVFVDSLYEKYHSNLYKDFIRIYMKDKSN